MYIRATTNGVLKGYQMNLNKSFTNMNTTRNTVLTQRNFNSYAEDVGSASRAFQMRRSMARVESQYAINDDCMSKYNVAYSAIDSIKDVLSSRTSNSAWSDVLVSLNDPTGDARTQLGQALDQLADTIVQTMNHKYDERFIFAGADGLNVPFSFNSAGQLCYRNVPVDGDLPDLKQKIDPNTGVATGDDYSIKLNAKGQYDASGVDHYVLEGKYSIVSSGGRPDVVQATINGVGPAPIEVNEHGNYVSGSGGYYLLQPDPDTGFTNKKEYDELPADFKTRLLTYENGTAVVFDKAGNAVPPDDVAAIEAAVNGGSPTADQVTAYNEFQYFHIHTTETISKERYDKDPFTAPPEGALQDADGKYVMVDQYGNVSPNGDTYDPDDPTTAPQDPYTY